MAGIYSLSSSCSGLTAMELAGTSLPVVVSCSPDEESGMPRDFKARARLGINVYCANAHEGNMYGMLSGCSGLDGEVRDSRRAVDYVKKFRDKCGPGDALGEYSEKSLLEP